MSGKPLQGLLIFCAVVCVVFSGCRPVSNAPAQRGPFGFNLPRIFGNGNGSQVAQNNRSNPFSGFPSLAGRSPNTNSSGFSNAGFSGFSGFSGNNVFGLGGNSNQPASPFSLPNGNDKNPNNAYAAAASEFNNLNQRITAYDTDNQLLNTELASLKQRLGMADQYSTTLKQQLADTEARARQAELAQQSSAQKLAEAQSAIAQLRQNGTTNQPRGQFASSSGSLPSQLPAATLNANNSLARRLADIQIPGGQARLDGDVIRIEFPSDRLLVPGQLQIQPAQLPLLQNIVGTVRENFSKQIIGIEAHWDNTPLNPGSMSHHQLTSGQALTVFDRLVAMGIPKDQLFTMSMGSNRPRYAQQVVNGIHPNRRVELVIYPETFDGR
ncbi:MAG: OmpA family protein [Planctomycetota bacterium]